jgi:hypothetical protein
MDRRAASPAAAGLGADVEDAPPRGGGGGGGDDDDDNDESQLIDDEDDEDDDDAYRMPVRQSTRRQGRVPRDAVVIPGGGECCLAPCLENTLGGRQIGNVYVLVERRARVPGGRPEFVCVIPACWPMLVVTEALICGLSVACYVSFFPYVGWLWILLGTASLGFVSGALACAGCSDPGIEPRRTESLGESWVWDESAQSYRPDNVQFCQESRVLVRDMDHFCPWTGTTIAGGNIRFFYAFIIGLFVQIFVLMGVFLAGNSAKTALRGGG